MRRSISYGCFDYYQNQLVKMALGGGLSSTSQYRGTSRAFAKVKHSFDAVSFAELLGKGTRAWNDPRIGNFSTTKEVQGKESNAKTGKVGSSRRFRHRTKEIMNSMVGQCWVD